MRCKMLVKRSFSLSGHRTSIALEPAFWAVLQAVADARLLPLAGLVGQIDSGRTPDQPLASALRVFALQNKPSAA
ncbi:MAG: ribbon-helix-helix domain-containing protein [Acidocella sp.]|nr:ribbon-helix-helix domain-containing protein [Acidocella sp.]